MKLSRKLLSLALAATMAGTLLAGCSNAAPTPSGGTSETTPSSTSSAPAESTGSTAAAGSGEKVLKMNVAGFQNQDPQIWTWGTHVDRMGIFEGPTRLTPELTAELANAEKLEHNDDFTVWTMTLRKDLQWSDGTPLNANDYYYSLQRCIDPAVLAGKTSAWAAADVPLLNASECRKGEKPFSEVGIKVVDDYTIEFTLYKPQANFDVHLAESWALPVPKHTIEKYGDEWTKPENIVVNGPYTVIDRKEDVQLTLGPNPNYYAPVNLDKIVLYMNSQDQLVSYQSGDINVAKITNANIDAVSADETLQSQMHTYETGVISYMGLIKSSNDVLAKNPKIRQAVYYSIDRETICKNVMRDTLTPAASLVSPNFADWGDEISIGGYDVEKAKQLMSEAGFPDGQGLEPMTLLIASDAGAGPDTLALAQMITAGTGIEVNIVPEEWAIFVKDRDEYHEDGMYGFWVDAIAGSNPGPVDYIYNGESGRFDPREASLTGEEAKKYREIYNSESIEEGSKTAQMLNLLEEASKDYPEGQQFWNLIQEAKKETDPAKQEALWKEACTIREQQCGYIPLWFTPSLKLIQPNIKGYVGNPLLLDSPPMYFNQITMD